jgi:NitT/TauT family transport system ATP-binding protein
VISPRPGRIERVFAPARPRPRGLDARRAREFTDTAQAITDIFLARGVLHGAGRHGAEP